MGKYNFDEMTIRRGTNCVKWDAESPVGPISEDVIPLWVADMDFKVAPEIVNVLKDRVDQEIFGYTHVPDSYYEAAVNWWERRRGWHTEKDWYLYIAGVVPAMSVTMWRSSPMKALMMLLLPTLGRPTTEKRGMRSSSSLTGCSGPSFSTMRSSRSPEPLPVAALTQTGSPSPRL